MRRTRSTAGLSIGVTLPLWTSLAIGGQEYGGGYGSRVGSWPGKGSGQFTGRIPCSRGALTTKLTFPSSRFYQLRHRLGQVVMEVTVGVEVVPYHSL
jgi:hypothetical protein